MFVFIVIPHQSVLITLTDSTVKKSSTLNINIIFVCPPHESFKIKAILYFSIWSLLMWNNSRKNCCIRSDFKQHEPTNHYRKYTVFIWYCGCWNFCEFNIKLNLTHWCRSQRFKNQFNYRRCKLWKATEVVFNELLSKSVPWTVRKSKV